MGIFNRKKIEELEAQLAETRDKQREQYNQLIEFQKRNSSLSEKISQLEKYKEDFEKIKSDYDNLKKRATIEFEQEIDKRVKELGVNRDKFEQLLDDRRELIELYVDKLYSLAKHFAIENKGRRENRGLFIILVDVRNLSDDNFSVFHEGQREHLNQESYIGIDNLPHIFSPKINEVFKYMGEKVERKDESGEIIGRDERDGAVLIDLRGIAFRTRMMVEGVRTHKVYDKVEALMEGNAKHNAAIYASSLNEVMAVIVISEETSKVTLFRDGKFVKSYNPYDEIEQTRADVFVEEETERDKKVVQMKPRLPDVDAIAEATAEDNKAEVEEAIMPTS